MSDKEPLTEQQSNNNGNNDNIAAKSARPKFSFIFQQPSPQTTSVLSNNLPIRMDGSKIDSNGNEFTKTSSILDENSSQTEGLEFLSGSEIELDGGSDDNNAKELQTKMPRGIGNDHNESELSGSDVIVADKNNAFLSIINPTTSQTVNAVVTNPVNSSTSSTKENINVGGQSNAAQTNFKNFAQLMASTSSNQTMAVTPTTTTVQKSSIFNSLKVQSDDVNLKQKMNQSTRLIKNLIKIVPSAQTMPSSTTNINNDNNVNSVLRKKEQNKIDIENSSQFDDGEQNQSDQQVLLGDIRPRSAKNVPEMFKRRTHKLAKKSGKEAKNESGDDDAKKESPDTITTKIDTSVSDSDVDDVDSVIDKPELISKYPKTTRAYRLMKEEIARKAQPTDFERKNFVDLNLESVLLSHAHSLPELNADVSHKRLAPLTPRRFVNGDLNNENVSFPSGYIESLRSTNILRLTHSNSQDDLAKTIDEIEKSIGFDGANGYADSANRTTHNNANFVAPIFSAKEKGKIRHASSSSGENSTRTFKAKKHHKNNKNLPTEASKDLDTTENKIEQDDFSSDKNTEKEDSTKFPEQNDSDILNPDLRDDLSTQLLILAKKSNWQAVQNMLDDVNSAELNFEMTDEKGFTVAHLAAKDNQFTVIERLLNLKVDLQKPTKDGRNLTHIAAMFARQEMMRYLIEHNFDVSQPAGPRRQFPLHLACMRSASDEVLSLVQLLLDCTIVDDRNPRLLDDKFGCIPLLLASEANNSAVIKELLKKVPQKQINWQRKDTNDTALHFGCLKRNEVAVRLLVEAGADANIQNVQGQTPLHIIAANGDENIMRLLHSARANANITDKSDRTPLHIAAEFGRTGMVEILCDKFKASVLARTKDGSTLMHIAAKNGHPDTALAFLKRGVPLNMPNRNGALGLHSAALAGHIGVLKTLLQKGTPVDAKTKDNYTALHVAVQAGKANVVETLLGFGANVHVRGGTLGETSLHLAAALPGNEGIKCAEMLLKSGGEVNITQENGETALHIAARSGNTEMIKLLLAEEADPMATSKIGESAVHIGAKFCHTEACRLVLQFVENKRRREDAVVLVNRQAQTGETALHYASEISPEMVHYRNEDSDLIKLLLDFGAEVNFQTILSLETPIHYCARSGNLNVLLEIVKKIGPGAVQIVLNKQSKIGWSPLLDAAEKGHTDIVKVLLQHNARVDVFDESGKTALHLSAENGHAEISDILLKNKAFVNSKTKLGLTPLHFSAMHGHEEVVRLLIEKHTALIDTTTTDNRTPLHVAAKHGQLQICSLLLSLGANPNAKDSKGQTPLHLAAESDYPEVVKVFLRMKPEMSTLTATDENGFTCAHIAAMKGSVAVIRELMMIDKEMVTHAVTKTTESTTLHLAAAGGHRHVVRILIEAGSEITSENATGMTPLHLAGKFGHLGVLEAVDKRLWNYCSRKTGLTPLHVGSHFGQIEFVRHMLGVVQATQKSEPPQVSNPLMAKDLQNEYGFTALHMAAQSGHEGLVRLLLNFQGVQVDLPSATQAIIPLHLAAQCGHVQVVGMLLSRSTTQLQLKDSRGRTSLHLAANNGHYDMVALLIGQGANINAMDIHGWTSLHFATKAGHLSVVRLLIEAGADAMAETKDAKIPICFAASANHYQVLSYLMHHDHDTHLLMEDRKFIFDLMVSGKSHQYKPIEDFVLLSPAPIDTAVKLSSVYRELSSKEKERTKDLEIVAEYCEDIASELLSIAATDHNAPSLLKSLDNRGRPFLDVLIENEQKKVVSHASVQRYLTEIWNGNVRWSTGKYVAFLAIMFFMPPVWAFFSVPFRFKICRAPQIKFLCHLVSHVYLTLLLIVEVLCLYQKIYQVQSIVPNGIEWILLLWISGVLVSELSNPGARTGLAIIRIAILLLSAIAVLFHVFAFLYPRIEYEYLTEDEQAMQKFTFLWVRNQLFATVLLLSFVYYLEFLTVHHLFGPWAIIIRDLLYDLTRFLVILTLFVAGFTLHVTAVFQPAYDATDNQSVEVMSPLDSLEMLFYALFGLTDPDQMPPLLRTPNFSTIILKIVFGVYMMITLIVLINLLIAMMSDTYQRIQAQSDTEWKFGRAKLIRQMNKLSATPAPINIFTKLYTVLKVALKNKCSLCSSHAQDDLRHEENLDSFTMTGAVGRTTPEPLLGAHEKKADDESGGVVVAVHIDKVIDWKHVVDTFYVFQGSAAEHEALAESTKKATASGEDIFTLGGKVEAVK